MNYIIKGTIITMDTEVPVAKAMLVEDGKIKKVYSDEDYPQDITVIEKQGFIFPGLIEPHGHPADSAMTLCQDVVDIRPVVIEDAATVMQAIKDRVATLKPGVPLLANGWDPLLQEGLPHIDREVLDKIAPENPLAVLHNSGHAVYFNSLAAEFAGVHDDSKDPVGAHWVKEDGKLVGIGQEMGCVTGIVDPILMTLEANAHQYFKDYCSSLNSCGITTAANFSGGQDTDLIIGEILQDGELTLRLRSYQMTTEKELHSSLEEDEEGMFRQVGAKVWADGSPWVGNIYTSFPYLSNSTTQSIGLEANHYGAANYNYEQLLKAATPAAQAGYQIACHAHGDRAIEETLDVYEKLITDFKLKDRRFRIEHCGCMTKEQFKRAASLGVAVSLFVDHIYYWGEVLLDLFDEKHASSWANAGAAEKAGVSVTYHNDGTVTPTEPWRNMQVAMDRTSRKGTVLAAELGASRQQALKAHTSEAAYQIHSEDEIGSLTSGKYADFIVIDQDPRTIAVENMHTMKVLETYLAGKQVYRATSHE